MQNRSGSIEKYCFKHKNLVGFRGPDGPSDTPPGAAHPGSPQSPDNSRSRYRHLCIIKNKSSAVAEMGDRGHIRHGPKRGGGVLCPFTLINVQDIVSNYKLIGLAEYPVALC